MIIARLLRSGPIIEHSSAARFAPYSLDYPALRDHLEVCPRPLTARPPFPLIGLEAAFIPHCTISQEAGRVTRLGNRQASGLDLDPGMWAKVCVQ